MADRVITAEALITAKDGTGDVFTKIASKFQQLGKGAKVSAEIERMNQTLEKSKQQLAALDKLQTSRAGFAEARAKFRAQQQAVEQAARAMKQAEKPTRDLQVAYERAQAAVSRTASAFEKSKAAMIDAKRAAEGFGAPLAKIASQQSHLRASIESTTRAIEHQAHAEIKSAEAAAKTVAAHKKAEHAAEHRAKHGFGAGVVHGAGHFTGATALIGGYGVIHAAERVGETYRHFDKERRYGRAVIGISDEEQKPLVDQAIHMGATTRFNDIQVLEAQRDLAARGLNKEQILGMMGAAADLGTAADLSLPDSVKQMEGAIFGFKKDISSTEAAKRSARQTADIQVRAMKMSGMTPDDIRDTYKYGATPARLSGVSEQTLLAFGGISKKANMAGNEAGTAFRALMSAANAPTRGAKEAMLANHLDYKNYQKKIDHIDVDPFVANVAAQYGVKLNKSAVAGLSKTFKDPKILNDPALFTPAVTGVLKGALGKQDAKSLKSIAGMANRFRTASGGGADVNAMLADLMKAMSNGKSGIALANAIFGAKQGGRIANALGDSETLKHMIELLEHHSEGYAADVAGQRNAGFDGAVARFQGAVTSLQTKVGMAIDNGGKGGLLTGATNAGAGALSAFAEAPPALQRLTVEAGALAGVFAAMKGAQSLLGGFGLKGAAVDLTAAAEALKGAALVQKGEGAAEAAAAGAGGASKAAGRLGKVLKAAPLIGLGVVAAEEGLGALNDYKKDHPNLFHGGARAAHAYGDDAVAPTFSLGRFGSDTPQTTHRFVSAPRRGSNGYWVDETPHPALAPISEKAGSLPTLAGPGGGITAEVKQPVPVDVTGKVQIEGQATVAVTVKVDGPGKVEGQFASSSGHIKVSTGTTMPGAQTGTGSAGSAAK